MAHVLEDMVQKHYALKQVFFGIRLQGSIKILVLFNNLRIKLNFGITLSVASEFIDK